MGHESPIMKAMREFAMADPENCDQEWAAYLALVNVKETAPASSPASSTSPLHHHTPAAAVTAPSTTRSTASLRVWSSAVSTDDFTWDDLSPAARRLLDVLGGGSSSPTTAAPLPVPSSGVRAGYFHEPPPATPTSTRSLDDALGLEFEENSASPDLSIETPTRCSMECSNGNAGLFPSTTTPATATMATNSTAAVAIDSILEHLVKDNMSSTTSVSQDSANHWDKVDVYPPLADLRRALMTDVEWAAMSEWEKDLWEMKHLPEKERLKSIEEIVVWLPEAQRPQRRTELLEEILRFGEPLATLDPVENLTAPTPSIYSEECQGGNMSATTIPSPTTVSTVPPPPTETKDVHEAVDINYADLVVLAPTTCSVECPSHAASVSVAELISAAAPNSFKTTSDISPELAAFAVPNEDLAVDTTSFTADVSTMLPVPWQIDVFYDAVTIDAPTSCTTTGGFLSAFAAPVKGDKALDVDDTGDTATTTSICLPGGPGHSTGRKHPAATSLTPWSASPLYMLPAEPSVFDTVQNSSITQQLQVLRLAPWLSLIGDAPAKSSTTNGCGCLLQPKPPWSRLAPTIQINELMSDTRTDCEHLHISGLPFELDLFASAVWYKFCARFRPDTYLQAWVFPSSVGHSIQHSSEWNRQILEYNWQLVLSQEKFGEAVHMHEAPVYWSWRCSSGYSSLNLLFLLYGSCSSPRYEDIRILTNRSTLLFPVGKVSWYVYGTAQFQWEIAWPTMILVYSTRYSMKLYDTFECSCVSCCFEIDIKCSVMHLLEDCSFWPPMQQLGGHWTFKYALLFSWDVTSAINSVPAMSFSFDLFSQPLQVFELGQYFAMAILLLSSHQSAVWIHYLPTTIIIQLGHELMLWEIASTKDGILTYTERVFMPWDPGGPAVLEAVTAINGKSIHSPFLHLTWDPGGYTCNVGLRASRFLRRGDCQRPSLLPAHGLAMGWHPWARGLPGSTKATTTNTRQKRRGQGGLEPDGKGGFGRGRV